MFSQDLVKPDGRKLTLYSLKPIPVGIEATSPSSDPVEVNPHMRWHPLRGEWVTYTCQQQQPALLNRSPSFPDPTELPPGDYDMAVFPNRSPLFCVNAHDPPESVVRTLPADGRCEVVVFSRDLQRPLASLSLAQIELLFAVWAHRTREIAGFKQIKYVLPFESYDPGEYQSLPHSQIHAYPFVPPVAMTMRKQERRYFRAYRQPLLEILIRDELALGTRVLYAGPHAVAFVPAWARYPYEVWIAPIRATPDFVSLTPEQHSDLARALKTVLMKYQGLEQHSFPYLMTWYQAPTDEIAHPECHLHGEFCSTLLNTAMSKQLAGIELAAGVFVNDCVPENKAAELRAVDVDIDADYSSIPTDSDRRLG